MLADARIRAAHVDEGDRQQLDPRQPSNDVRQLGRVRDEREVAKCIAAPSARSSQRSAIP
jgi:hypothetical protein